MQEQYPRTRPLIEVRGIRKEYPLGDETVVALKGINLNIMRGEICCIFGTSGSGKSTFLNQLAGMEKPTRGVVRIGGVPVSQLDENKLAAFRQRHVGFVFQSYNLLPHLTATENVALPLMFRGVPRKEREEAARKMLCRVGLPHRLDHFPRQMSGGQQQRVGIARAFIARPDVVFADEPTGNLDSKTSRQVLLRMLEMSKKEQITFVMVTHEPSLAACADRIITILDGKVQSDVVPPEEERIRRRQALADELARDEAEEAAREKAEQAARQAQKNAGQQTSAADAAAK